MKAFQSVVKKLFYSFLILPFTIFAQDTNLFQASWGPNFRTLNDVAILDQGNAVAVGGWKVNDAITTIVSTQDSGSNWGIVTDNLNAWLQETHFVNANEGFAVGWNGLVMKTTDGGDNWSTLNIPSSAHADFNGLYFFNNQEGIVVGGTDSTRLIISTADGGANWSVVESSSGSALHDVTFHLQNGIAVGANSQVYRSSDYGASWTTAQLNGFTHTRSFNAVEMLPNGDAVLVGGNLTNDSISTILHSSNNFDNVSVSIDQIGSMLNDIEFYNSTDAYAVGNDGIIYQTTNSGTSWSLFQLGLSDWSLNAVKFINQYYGFMVGNDGKIIKYVDTVNLLADGFIDTPIFKNDSGVALINAIGNDAGVATEYWLEYGVSGSYDSLVLIQQTSGQGSVNMFHNLEGLMDATMYQLRLKMVNGFGTNYSDAVYYYHGETSVPNFSFEHWTDNIVDRVDEWNNFGSVNKLSGHNGGYAPEISGINQEVGAILHGQVVQGDFRGGVPISGNPTAISYYAKYDVAQGDQALVICMLKSNGNIFYDTVFAYTGTESNWTQQTINLNYTGSETADSIILGFTSSNVLSGNVNPNSVVSIDEVDLVGISTNVPNADLEDWTEEEVNYPINWYVEDGEQISFPVLVDKEETTVYSGDYALKLENRTGNDSRYSGVSTASTHNIPSFPVQTNHQALYGYYQFQPMGGDTLRVRVHFYNQGNQIGYGEWLTDQTTNSYELFEVEINYWDTSIADSASIRIEIVNESAEPSASVAYVDNLIFDAQFYPVGLAAFYQEMKVNVYPNPATDYFIVDAADLDGQNITWNLYSIEGRLVHCQHHLIDGNKILFDIAQLPKQLYILNGNSTNQAFSKKILVQ